MENDLAFRPVQTQIDIDYIDRGDLMKKPFVIGVFISLVMVSHLANAENKDKDFRCWDINKRGDLPASQLYGNVVAGCDTQKPYSISPLISSGNVIRTTICCWGK